VIIHGGWVVILVLLSLYFLQDVCDVGCFAFFFLAKEGSFLLLFFPSHNYLRYIDKWLLLHHWLILKQQILFFQTHQPSFIKDGSLWHDPSVRVCERWKLALIINGVVRQ
jgi:hypothetical protein